MGEIDNDLFTLYTSENECKIHFKSLLTTKLWAENFGSIQNLLFSTNFQFVVFDVSKSTWADPFVLLSMILTLLHCKNAKSGTMIIIPRVESDFSKEDIDNISRGKFLKFLSQEGFLDIFISEFYVSNSRKKITKADVKTFASYKYNLMYSDSKILTAHVIDLRNREEPHQIVDKLIVEEVSTNLGIRVSGQIYNNLLSQIFHYLCEFVDNVKEHAYPNRSTSYVGLYVRFRKGFLGNENDCTNSQLQFESSNCPLLSSDIIVCNNAVIEIFVVDDGIGLSNSLMEKYTTRELFEKVLKDGVRRDCGNYKTAYGGLHFITRLLEENDGSFWCIEHDEFVNAYAREVLAEHTKIKTGVVSAATPISGLYWCLRIPCLDTRRKYNDYYVCFDKSPIDHPAYKLYCDCDKNLTCANTLIFDERYNSKETISIANTESGLTWQEDHSNIDNSFESYFCFPKRKVTKNIIIEKLRAFYEKYVDPFHPSLIDPPVLYLIDIPSNELITYYITLNNIMANTIISQHIYRVVVIGQHFEIMVFEMNRSNLIFDKEKASLMFAPKDNEVDQHGFREVFKLVRQYDSFLFWDLVDKNNSDGTLFIDRQIEWRGNSTIRGYLDFDYIFTHECLKELLKNSLERVKGLFISDDILFVNTDVVTKRFCTEVQESYLEASSSASIIAVGSVWVTGYTIKSNLDVAVGTVNIHLFIHRDSSKVQSNTLDEVVAHLLFWRQTNPNIDSEERAPLRRLGKSHLIGEGSSVVIASSDDFYRNVKISNKSDAYYDLQSTYPPIAKAGHYMTDKHHYFLAFDFCPVVKQSFFRKDGLFVYLLCNFFYRLVSESEESVYFEEMKSEQKNEWERAIRKEKKSYSDCEKVTIVLYHSNTYTEFIISFIKRALPTELAKRILPVKLHRIQTKGMPPVLSLNVINKIISNLSNDKSRGNRVLFFDSNISSGQTMNRIRNTISSAVNADVPFTSLSIVNTQLLPFVNENSFSYWKFNLPRIDNADDCTICKACEIITAFMPEVCSEARQRLIDWKQQWVPIDVSNNVINSGITTVPLPNNQRLRSAIPKYVNNSLGLLMHINEYLCEQYDNDYPVRLCNNNPALPSAVRLQLLCSQILLFGNQTSKQLQRNILFFLIKLVAEISNDNGYDNSSSLASLILMSQDSHEVMSVLNRLYSDPTTRQIIDKSDSKDLVVVMSYFIFQDNEISRFAREIVRNSEIARQENDAISIMKKAFDTLMPEKSFKNHCKVYHGIIINEQGKVHDNAIRKALDTGKTTYMGFKDAYSRVTDMFYIINMEINSISLVYKNSNYIDYQILYQVMSQITRASEFIKIDLADKTRKCDTEKNYSEEKLKPSNEVRNELESLLIKLVQLHDAFFICNNYSAEECFKKIVFDIATRQNRKINFNFGHETDNKDTNIKRYYYWNYGIELEAEYFLENVASTMKKIVATDGSENDMLVYIKCSDSNLQICTVSYSSIDAKSIETAFYMKNRLSKVMAISFDTEFKFVPLSKEEELYKVQCEMIIPTVFGQIEKEG